MSTAAALGLLALWGAAFAWVTPGPQEIKTPLCVCQEQRSQGSVLGHPAAFRGTGIM